MPSTPTVVLLSLLLAITAMIFWLWLVAQPIRDEIPCPEDCRCEEVGSVLNCSDSGLNRIPSNLPTQARKLVLDGNNITSFENDSFVSKGLVDLEMLEADFCKIRKIDLGAFNGLTTLTYLSLMGNDISEIITGTFEMINSLKYLDLKFNKIKHLGSDVFRGLAKINSINLEGNDLQYLHPDTFERLPNLQNLYVAENPGLQIPTERHFINSHSLKHLGISGCNVSSVSVETFANVSTLEWLDLSYNNLRILDISVLKVLPGLSTLYMNANSLQCDCQLQKVWRWCQDQNIQTVNEGMAPECDTPSEVKGLWWGVLEKGQCLQDNIQYYGDYNNTSYSYTPIDDVDNDIKTDTVTENELWENIYSVLKQYRLPVSAVFFIFGTTVNVIIIIIITCNKDMRTVPNMYIINLAISDMIYLTILCLDALRGRIDVTWLGGEIGCALFIFFYRMSVSLIAYSVAVLSLQRYRLTVNPIHVHVSLQPTWRGTGAIICGVWIVAAFFAIPEFRSQFMCNKFVLLLLINYYYYYVLFQLLVSCVFPLCVIAFSYTMTARHLVENSCSVSEETQNPRLNTQKSTTKVMTGLTVVFLISYMPFHIAETYLFYKINFENPFSIFTEGSYSLNYLIKIRLILKYLLSINSCLNPVALFCTSLAFRRHFKRCLTCCCKTKSPPTDLEL